MTDGPTISLCMIVKNEEACLRRCLESLAGAVDEIVVVDTGSTDGTVAIAESFGARLSRGRWTGDFSAARNAALDQAKGSWILTLDADEELDLGSAARIREAVATSGADGLRLRLRNILPAGDLCRFDEAWLTRLYRNDPRHRYEGPIHEQIKPSIQRHGGLIEDADITIIHHGYAQRSSQGDMVRALRNLDILATALAASPDDAYLHYQLGITYKSLGRAEAARGHLRRVLELDTAGMDAEVLESTHMKLAQLELGRNDHAAALAAARASLGYNPDNTIALFVAAVSSMYRGEIRAAYDHFVKIRRSPRNDLAATADLDRMIQICGKALGIA